MAGDPLNTLRMAQADSAFDHYEPIDGLYARIRNEGEAAVADPPPGDPPPADPPADPPPDGLARIATLLEEQAKRDEERDAALTKGVQMAASSMSLALPTFTAPHILKTRGEDDLKVEEAVLLQSCWHYGEDVSEEETAGFGGYNVAMCQARIQEMADSVIGLITDHHRGLKIRKLWVVNVGDNISGDIHDELKITNEVPLVSQFLGCGLLQALSLRDLAAVVDEVEYIGIR
ncbi:hypothetical protein LCGC14_2260660, partial [marine sediment metagenome]